MRQKWCSSGEMGRWKEKEEEKEWWIRKLYVVQMMKKVSLLLLCFLCPQRTLVVRVPPSRVGWERVDEQRYEPEAGMGWVWFGSVNMFGMVCYFLSFFSYIFFFLFSLFLTHSLCFFVVILIFCQVFIIFVLHCFLYSLFFIFRYYSSHPCV